MTKKFSDTLLLPKTTFPLWSNSAKSEEPFRLKTCDELYRWQRQNATGPLFVLHDGPPYANGDLHMGHALNKILKDIINRYHLSLGQRVHYHPGWDCHGLPIETKAFQRLKKDPLSLPATTVRDEAKAFAEQEVESQKDEFRQLGIMADWDNAEATYRTLDHEYEIRQLRVFQKMVEHGLIYTDFRPVHYSPSSRSALAEAELVYQDDHVSHSVYVAFAVNLTSERIGNLLRELLKAETDVHLLVWTTTPWTLTANMGIAVHPDLTYTILRQVKSGRIYVAAKDRVDALEEVLGTTESLADVQGTDLIGLDYQPLFSKVAPSVTPKFELRVIPAAHVTATSGTGLVHCAPAHGAEDYNAFRTVGLLQPGSGRDAGKRMLCHVDHLGRFDDDVREVLGERGKDLEGKDVLREGGKAAVELCEAAGVLLAVKKLKHRYPYDWKTKEPIIVRATSQWFANLDKIKDDAVTALKDVTFFPEISRNRLESFIRSRSEWCISRQRVWGVPIPSLYRVASGDAVLDTRTLDHILAVLEKKGVAHWWNGPVGDFVPAWLTTEGEAVEDTWAKGLDTMDVWFDSGSSWSMLRDVDEEGTRKHLADVCLEGSDQHRGWFQSQLLTAVASAEDDSGSSGKSSPYSTLITHGMVLDDKGKKMSKSLGNIVSPMIVVNGGKDKKKQPAYGAEVLRLWAATVEYWHDMALGPTVLAQSAESLRKIRNSARFILGNIGDDTSRKAFVPVPKEELGLVERYIMHELYKLENTALEAYASYNFPKVVNVLSNFANITLSSLYLDITKDSLYADAPDSMSRRSVVTVLERVLTTVTQVIGPILPHLAEEIHHTRIGAREEDKGLGPSVFTERWTPLGPEWEDVAAEQEMGDLLRVRAAVLSLLEQARKDKKIRSSLEAEVDFILPDVASGQPDILALLQREEKLLKTLLIVSDASLTDEGSLGTSSSEWSFTDSLSISGDQDIGIRVRPASLHKCPRCWTYTRAEEDVLCTRCSGVVKEV